VTHTLFYFDLYFQESNKADKYHTEFKNKTRKQIHFYAC